MVQPIAAATPAIEFDRDQTVSFAIADCGTFTIVGLWNVDIRIVTSFDATGTPVREDFQAHFKGTLSNSVTGKSIDDSGALHNVTDLVTGVVYSSGMDRHDTAPHFGLLLSDAGRVIFDAAGNVVFFGGNPHTDTTAICAYLGS